jgi:hypothetical protein
MNRAIALIIFSIGCAVVARAGDPSVKVSLSNGPREQPATVFSPSTEKIYAMFKAKGTNKGDKVRGALIAEYVGDVAPANTTVLEKTLELDEDPGGGDYSGDFNFSKPTNDWPVGKYRVDIYVNDELAATAKFLIKPFKKKQAEEEEQEREEEESGD